MFGAVFAFVFGLVITAFNAYRVSRLWDDRAYYERSAVSFSYGGYSLEFRRGIVRAWLPLTLGFAALTIFAGIYLFAMLSGLNPVRTFATFQLALVGLFMLGFVLTLVVAWFNVPKFLVPPYLRSEPGYRRAGRAGAKR